MRLRVWIVLGLLLAVVGWWFSPLSPRVGDAPRVTVHASQAAASASTPSTSAAPAALPNLPVARVMWRAMPNLSEGVECWITAGGAHHTVLSYDVTAEQMKDWAKMMDIEFVHINSKTTVDSLEHDLFLADLAWKLK